MGMKNAKNIKKDIAKRTRPSDEELGKINSNNGDAGAIISGLTAGNKTISYDVKDIPLSDIRVNPDNEIFNSADTEEDTITLAEDIQRNGLMHNLVVFPKEENGKTVYVLLSGERRFKAMQYLERKGDATWNTVKNCSVITTELSDNEKKVLLYSANLQVRGGFGNEKIRRKAVTAFIDCLRKEPYNLTETEAKKTIKGISPENTKTLDKDVRIERKLCEGLKELLDSKHLTRGEADTYQRFAGEKQEQIAERLYQLYAVDCGGNAQKPDERNSVEIRRDNLHSAFRDALFVTADAGTYNELDELFTKALADFDNGFQTLKAKVAEYDEAKKTHTEKQLADLEHANVNEAAKEKVEQQKTTVAATSSKPTIVQKKAPAIKKQLDSMINRKNYVQSLSKYSQEMLDMDIGALDEVIEAATTLKEMIMQARKGGKAE